MIEALQIGLIVSFVGVFVGTLLAIPLLWLIAKWLD